MDELITGITTSNFSPCESFGTPDPDDDIFTADVTVTFTTIPAAGTLELSGAGTASVPVASLVGNSHTFTGVTMTANGIPIVLTATFSDSPACPFTTNNAGIAPVNCSGACFVTIVDVITTDQGCPGVNDGTITIIAFGSSAQLGYSINGGQSYQISNYFGNLQAGTYNISVVVYGLGCTATTTATVGGPTGTGQTWYKDADGDGYSDGVSQTSCVQPGPEYYLAAQLIATSGDCNDYDPNQFPGQTWYKDWDNDGWSDGVTLVQCSRPVGYKYAGELIATSGDCDDNDPNVNPGAPEICNGIDDNCNGLIDEGLGDLTYVGNVVFTTQSQVNAWSQCYTIIQGNLTIKNAGIVHINTLTNIRKVTGNVLIELTGLDSLNGLVSLDTVGGNLTVKQNFQLETLHGLDSLTRVGGNLAIFFNLKLSDCCAIHDLLNDPNGIGGSVSIYTNKTGCDNVGQINAACAPGSPIAAPTGNGWQNQVSGKTALQRVDVFPNPATDRVTVRIYESFESGTVRFYDMQGRLLRQQVLGADSFQYSFNLGNLPHGTYLFHITVDGEQFTEKLVVE